MREQFIIRATEIVVLNKRAASRLSSRLTSRLQGRRSGARRRQHNTHHPTCAARHRENRDHRSAPFLLLSLLLHRPVLCVSCRHASSGSTTHTRHTSTRSTQLTLPKCPCRRPIHRIFPPDEASLSLDRGRLRFTTTAHAQAVLTMHEKATHDHERAPKQRGTREDGAHVESISALERLRPSGGGR